MKCLRGAWPQLLLLAAQGLGWTARTKNDSNYLQGIMFPQGIPDEVGKGTASMLQSVWLGAFIICLHTFKPDKSNREIILPIEP